MSEYFTVSGSPSTGAAGASSPIRSEFSSISAGFDKLPLLGNNSNQAIFVNSGGTALSSVPAATARTNLGLGSIATQNANNVAITGGTISGIATALNSANIFVGNAGNVATSVALSGDATLANTGALTLANTAVTAADYGNATRAVSLTVDAKGRLTAVSNQTIAINNSQVSGLGTMATQQANNVAITGGSITSLTALTTNNATITGGTANNVAITSSSLGSSTATTQAIVTNNTTVATTAYADASGKNAATIAAGRNIASRTNSGTPNTKFDMTADEICLRDSNNLPFFASSVNVTVNMAGTGANGIDTGAQASSTWYYGWVIAKTDGTIAGLASLSSSAPTMPAGYTFKALVTAVYSDGSTHFVKYRQMGNQVSYEAGQVVLSGGSSTSEAAVSVSAVVPPNALSFTVTEEVFQMSQSGNTIQASWSLRYISGSAFRTGSYMTLQGGITGAGQLGGHSYEVPNVSQQFFYLITVVTGSGQSLTLNVCGFKLPLGGE